MLLHIRSAVLKCLEYPNKHGWLHQGLDYIVYLRYCIDFDSITVFANGPGDLGSTPGRIIPETLKMVLDTSLLNIQQYKVRIKGKVEHSREMSSVLPYTSVL